jgi:hypothetical protein
VGKVRLARWEPDRAAVRGAHGAVAGRVEGDAGLDDLVADALDGARPLASRQLRHGRREVADGVDDVLAGPGGAESGELLDHLGDAQRRLDRGRLARRGSHGGDDRFASPAHRRGFVDPTRGQRPGRCAGFGSARVLGGLPSEGGALPPGRVSTLPRPELADLDRQELVDLAGALGERGEQLGGHADDLGLALDDRTPGDAIAVGELGPKHRLVQAAEGSLLALEGAGVERHPPSRGLDLGGDDDVAVELGVVLAGGGLAERRHGEPAGLRVLAVAVDPHPRGGGVALDVVEHGAHRQVVRLGQPRVAGQAPPHRQRLRRRERRVEPAHGADQPALGVDAVDQLGAEPRPRDGVAAAQERFEVLGRHRPGQSQSLGLPAEPDALAFRALVGQVAGVVAGRVMRAVGVDGGHPQHDALLSPPAGTCLTC